MTARYRIVYYVPDPLTQERVAVGALTESGGRVVVVQAGARHATLGRADQVLVRASLGELTSTHHIEELPMGVGPQIVASAAFGVPTGVTDAAAWVEASLFPARAPGAAAPRLHRAKAGWEFLRIRHVQKFVRTRFRLASAKLLGPISLYVEGRSETLLLEPLAMSRPHAANELREVAQSLAAYATALRNDPSKKRIAYFLAGGPDHARAEAIEQLRDFAEIVDTAVPHQSDAFVDRVRTVGESLDFAA